MADIPIYHTYNIWEPRFPTPGDKALCGHIKHSDDPDPSGLVPFWGQPCVVCEDLDRYYDWVYDESDLRRTW